MADLCHFLGREFVCGIFTWPAGGSRGMMAGYNVDRESGEFAVQHLKQAIRLIAQTPGVERIHLMAHSRGTDVAASALRELNIEAHVAGDSVADRFRLIWATGPLRSRARSGPGVHITSYVSWGDKAPTLSQFLFGSVVRLGRVDVARLSKEQVAKAVRLAYLLDFVELKATAGFLGHSYFTSDPAVSSDLIALICYDLKPGRAGPTARRDSAAVLANPRWYLTCPALPAAYPPPPTRGTKALRFERPPEERLVTDKRTSRSADWTPACRSRS